MSQFTSSVLTTKGAVLAYALPLLFVSFTVTFAGTYLTFDRTRSFPPLENPEEPVVLDIPGADMERGGTKDRGGAHTWEKLRFESQVPKANPRFARLIRSHKNKVKWRLEGGVGGLLTGSILGVFIPTALTLYIIQHTSRTMASIPFLVMTYISVILFSLLGARFHQAALILGSIGGSFAITAFTDFAVDFTTVARLSLWAALSLLLLVVPILSFVSPNKFSTSLHWSMRLAQSSLGGMGAVYSIGVLADVPGWADAMTSLWSTSHHNGATLALSVMGWLLLILGIGCDWTLYKTLGPSPDQTWDNYLARYLDNLPNRAGHFERLPSFWSRITSVFHKNHHDPLPNSIDGDSFSSRITKVRESPKRRMTRKGAPAVRFDLATSSSEEDLPSQTHRPRSRDATSDHSSDHTLQDPGTPSQNQKAKLKDDDEWTIDKYETEADITSTLRAPNEDKYSDWKPAFLLKNHDMKPKTNNDDLR